MLDDRPPAAESATPDATTLRTLLGAVVRNPRGASLGRIEDAAIDVDTGALAYALLAFDDFTGVTKRFVIPWGALRLDTRSRCLLLDLDPEVLERAPGLGGPSDIGDPGQSHAGMEALAVVGAAEEANWRRRRAERFGP